MRKSGDSFELSATDLVGYLNCRHLSALERAVAEGALRRPYVSDPLLKILWERGSIHEQNYVDHLTKVGLEVVRIDGFDVSPEAVAATTAAMRQGAQIIAQGAFSHQGWIGRADILRRIEVPSLLGAWSYEAIDTKLSRETKAGAVLQLCLYSDLIKEIQGLTPEHMFVVVPWSDFEPQQYRFVAHYSLAVADADPACSSCFSSARATSFLNAVRLTRRIRPMPRAKTLPAGSASRTSASATRTT
jgi:predicted RecB family nuclease